MNELVVKNERLLDSGNNTDDIHTTDSPQKSSFLSTFRSALRNGGRTGGQSNGGGDIHHPKNLGQSLSLNDLTLLSLEVEDGKKDVSWLNRLRNFLLSCFCNTLRLHRKEGEGGLYRCHFSHGLESA